MNGDLENIITFRCKALDLNVPLFLCICVVGIMYVDSGRVMSQ